MADDPYDLSPEETQVMLGRFAGASIADLARSTGMPAQRVRAIVTRLSEIGLLGAEDAPSDPGGADPEPARSDARAFAATEPAPPGEHHAHDDLVALLEAATLDLFPGRLPALPPHTEAPPRHTPPSRMTPPARRHVEGEAPPAPPPPPEEPPARAEEAQEADAAPGEDTREYRKLFETELHPLPVEQRVALAGEATGAKLMALCFDPDAKVIAAVFENTGAGLEHARLVAFHHRDPRGLEVIAGNPRIANDPQVHRRLLRNPALTEPMLKRLLGSKRLVEVHKATLDRDVPERSRVAARGLLRTKFATAQAEDRVDLVWSTEGRVLQSLMGATFDSRTTSILCSKTYSSIMLVQNLARFPATPPALLAYLLRQPLVKRQQQLKNALLQHPNMPSEAKRRA